MSISQLTLPFSSSPAVSSLEQLESLLSQDLNFHDQDSTYASHNFHSFPAKFPPQLPRLFIEGLTRPGDIVLDPMQGSGTTILEALLTGRQAIGFDIDWMAVLISRVKSTPLAPLDVMKTNQEIIRRARVTYNEKVNELTAALDSRWNPETRRFIDYWFDPQTQLALMALILEIEIIADPALRHYFTLAFSSIIITKTGGVSLALDLAHTRPHRAKLVYSESGALVEGAEYLDQPLPNIRFATKTLRPVFAEFDKRVKANIKGILRSDKDTSPAQVAFGNAFKLPLPNQSIDLIVTSPPYASNAIDYMRAHKFSLVWMGYPIDILSEKRGKYIGGEVISDFEFESLPAYTTQVVNEIQNLDVKKGAVLRRYYSEMSRVLREMYRVLKPGKASILVVGSSLMRGRDTETSLCLADIGRSLGFIVPKIGIHQLDRDRRMMPAGNKIDKSSIIQQRMHEEYVIGFYKP